MPENLHSPFRRCMHLYPNLARTMFGACRRDVCLNFAHTALVHQLACSHVKQMAMECLHRGVHVNNFRHHCGMVIKSYWHILHFYISMQQMSDILESPLFVFHPIDSNFQRKTGLKNHGFHWTDWIQTRDFALYKYVVRDFGFYSISTFCRIWVHLAHSLNNFSFICLLWYFVSEFTLYQVGKD